VKTFRIWLERRNDHGPLVPEVDRVLRFIMQAGGRGATRSELSNVKLPPRLVNDLIVNLAQLGMVSVSQTGQGQIIRYCCRL